MNNNTIDKMCIEVNCKVIPLFNEKGKKEGIYCNTHKKEKMIDVKDKTCIEKDCKIIPSFNVEGEKEANYCSVHKKDGMIDVKNKTCLTYLCGKQVTNKYKGYCMTCFIHVFPDEPVFRNYKTKEKTVSLFVMETFWYYDWVIDKALSSGCSKRRPDLLLNLGFITLIIEVDEEQHTGYTVECENNRMTEIYDAIEGMPTVFFRFNPDGYIDEEGNKVSSCFTQNKLGVTVIEKENEWIERLSTLKNQIEFWSKEENKTDRPIEIVKLFYDEL